MLSPALNDNIANVLNLAEQQLNKLSNRENTLNHLDLRHDVVDEFIRR